MVPERGLCLSLPSLRAAGLTRGGWRRAFYFIGPRPQLGGDFLTGKVVAVPEWRLASIANLSAIGDVGSLTQRGDPDGSLFVDLHCCPLILSPSLARLS